MSEQHRINVTFCTGSDRFDAGTFQSIRYYQNGQMVGDDRLIAQRCVVGGWITDRGHFKNQKIQAVKPDGMISAPIYKLPM